MPYFLNVPLSEGGVAETTGKIEMVNSRTHATELHYGDAAYLQALAQERWPTLAWQIEHVRTAAYVVKGETKQ